jgi:hypothetical protein
VEALGEQARFGGASQRNAGENQRRKKLNRGSDGDLGARGVLLIRCDLWGLVGVFLEK